MSYERIFYLKVHEIYVRSWKIPLKVNVFPLRIPCFFFSPEELYFSLSNSTCLYAGGAHIEYNRQPNPNPNRVLKVPNTPRVSLFLALIVPVAHYTVHFLRASHVG